MTGVLETLEGTGCRYCAGTLARGAYRGDDALVCGECGTPAVRLF